MKFCSHAVQNIIFYFESILCQEHFLNGYGVVYRCLLISGCVLQNSSANVLKFCKNLIIPQTLFLLKKCIHLMLSLHHLLLITVKHSV